MNSPKASNQSDNRFGNRPLMPSHLLSIRTEMEDALRNLSTSLIPEVANETGYTTEDLCVLWKDMEAFIHGLVYLVNRLLSTSHLETALIRNEPPGGEIRYEPLGRVLVCLPQNAIVPLGLIVPLALAAGGNKVLIASPQNGRRTVEAFARIINRFLPGSVTVWNGRIRDAVSQSLDGDNPVDALFFLGSSKNYPEIAARCARAGVTLIFEGEARGAVLVDDTLTGTGITEAAQAIFRAKTFCNGKMCSSPNVVVVAEQAADEFLAIYKELCQNYILPAPLDSLASPEVCQSLERAIKLGNVCPDPRQYFLRSPFLVTNVPLDEVFGAELFCPAAYFVTFSNFEQVCAAIAAQRHRLQVSLYSKDVGRLNTLIQSTGYARYCFCLNPIYQNPLMPWGNYGASGYSDVRDYYAKGMRRIVVEGLNQPSVLGEFN